MASSLARPVIFFGKIVTSDIPKAVKVSIDKYVMDKRLTMYFKEKTEVYAYDSKKLCSEGDYVIIREIPADTFEDKHINFNIEKLVYKAGYFVDPLSGRRNAGTEYIDDIMRITELFGCTRPYQKSEFRID